MKKQLTTLTILMILTLLPLLGWAQIRDRKGQIIDTIEVYNPSTLKHTKSIIINNENIRIISDTVEIYDPVSGKLDQRIIHNKAVRKGEDGMRPGRGNLRPGRTGMRQNQRDWYRTPEENEMNLKKYKKGRNVGIGLLIGGAVVSGIGGSMVAFSFVEKDSDGEYYFTEDPKPIPLIAGAGTFMLGTAAMTTGTVLTIVNSIKLAKTRKDMRRYGSLDISSGRNGLGLSLTF